MTGCVHVRFLCQATSASQLQRSSLLEQTQGGSTCTLPAVSHVTWTMCMADSVRLSQPSTIYLMRLRWMAGGQTLLAGHMYR